MSAFDKEDRIKLVLDEVEKKIKPALNKVSVGYTNYSIHDSLGYILIETDSKLYIGDELYSILSKSKYGIYKESIFNEGFFDWSSDTFIKPSIEVIFTV